MNARPVDLTLTLWWNDLDMDPSWYLYAGIFIGPFVQEDAAVIAAATLSAADPRHFPIVFFIILMGLFVSDIWKYWIGYSAHASSRARKWAESERVTKMGDRIEQHAITTLLAARFVPLARVPAYIACGYFKMNYLKFCAIIFVTALLYCTVIFGIIHLLGEVFGEQMEIVLGVMAIITIFVIVSSLGIKAWLNGRKAD